MKKVILGLTAFGVVAVALIVLFSACKKDEIVPVNNVGIKGANNFPAVTWNGAPDKLVAVNIVEVKNDTRKNASGPKITSNAHSSDFPGIYFIWDSKQKDNGYLKVASALFDVYESFVLTTKESNTYWDFPISIQNNQQQTEDNCYVFYIPKVYNNKNINMVFVSEFKEKPATPPVPVPYKVTFVTASEPRTVIGVVEARYMLELTGQNTLHHSDIMRDLPEAWENWGNMFNVPLCQIVGGGHEYIILDGGYAMHNAGWPVDVIGLGGGHQLVQDITVTVPTKECHDVCCNPVVKKTSAEWIADIEAALAALVGSGSILDVVETYPINNTVIRVTIGDVTYEFIGGKNEGSDKFCTIEGTRYQINIYGNKPVLYRVLVAPL